jgi:hypothetical protein
MRTIALLASMGLLAAAEQPKPTPAPLKTAERMALTELSAKVAELNKQIDVILTEACADRNIPKDRCRLQQDGTFLTLPEQTKPEVKK